MLKRYLYGIALIPAVISSVKASLWITLNRSPWSLYYSPYIFFTLMLFPWQWLWQRQQCTQALALLWVIWFSSSFFLNLTRQLYFILLIYVYKSLFSNIDIPKCKCLCLRGPILSNCLPLRTNILPPLHIEFLYPSSLIPFGNLSSIVRLWKFFSGYIVTFLALLTYMPHMSVSIWYFLILSFLISCAWHLPVPFML